MANARGRRKRARGSIEELPSGALRVRLYAGIDPVTKKRLYLTETVPKGQDSYKKAEQELTRLQNKVDEQRTPRTSASLNRLLDRYLEVIDVAGSTRRDYISKINKHVRPLLGETPAARVGVETLESLYADLRRCKEHCRGRKYIEHRTSGPHECDEHSEAGACSPPDPDCRMCRRMCGPHVCTPLADSTIRAIHWILKGAYDSALRWEWVRSNPAELAKPPAMPKPNPRPPSVGDAARLVQESASRDPDWGALVWTAMTTGARRGEICALHWHHLDLDAEVIEINRAIGLDDDRHWAEKDTKSHQQRRVVVDTETVAVLCEHLARCRDRAAALGVEFDEDGYVFSLSVDGSTFIKPDTVTGRYDRMAERLEIDTTLHKLRHYSATELITAGVDIRTIAGRLGHGGGGATTLRVYSAWLAEADQRAAKSLAGRMPARSSRGEAVKENDSTAAPLNEFDPDRGPYMRIARDLQGAIACGALAPGYPIPTVKETAARYGVSVATAHRAMAILKAGGLIQATRGRRAVVAPDPLLGAF
jgi:integrase